VIFFFLIYGSLCSSNSRNQKANIYVAFPSLRNTDDKVQSRMTDTIFFEIGLNWIWSWCWVESTLAYFFMFIFELASCRRLPRVFTWKSKNQKKTQKLKKLHSISSKPNTQIVKGGGGYMSTRWRSNTKVYHFLTKCPICLAGVTNYMGSGTSRIVSSAVPPQVFTIKKPSCSQGRI